MTQVDKNLKLVQTKLALAQKYQHLAQLAGSQPKRKKYLYMAEKYRRQAGRLSQ